MALNQTVIERIGVAEVELTQRLVGDISEIFSTMVGIDDVRHLAQEVEPAPSRFKDSVTAMVGLAGSCNGLVCMHTSQKSSLCFTAQMLGMDVSEVADDVTDALGEIANMIGGSFKHHLSSGGDDIKLSTPSVVMGSDYTFSSGHPGDALTLVFDANNEQFMVSVVLELD